MIMTHGDRAGDPPGRREAAGDAGHRQGFPTPSGGSPARPERRLPKAFGRPMALRWGPWLPMSRIATPRAPGRKPWEAVSMGHYQRDLVLRGKCRLYALKPGQRHDEPGGHHRLFRRNPGRPSVRCCRLRTAPLMEPNGTNRNSGEESRR